MAQENQARELDIEQKQAEKPLGLLAGLVQVITEAFTEHKERLRERVIELREKRPEVAENEQSAINPETPRPWLLTLLDNWLFKEPPAAEVAAQTPAQARELVHIGMDKTALVDNPEADPQRELGGGDLMCLKPSPTPRVTSSRSQSLGHSMMAA